MCKKEMSFQRKRGNSKSVHVHRREHREQKQLGNNQRLKNTATDKIAPPHFSFINLKHLLPLLVLHNNLEAGSKRYMAAKHGGLLVTTPTRAEALKIMNAKIPFYNGLKHP
jgi:hypothetical protein